MCTTKYDVFPRGGVYDAAGSLQAFRESSTRATEGRDMDDGARGVAVLFPSWLHHCPCQGLHQLLTIRKESASEDDGERKTMGSCVPGTETDVLSCTIPHGPGRVTADQTLQDLGSASRQLRSAADVALLEQGRVRWELATLGKVFLDHHQSMDYKSVLKSLW